MEDSNKKPIVYSALEVANLCGVVNQTAINWIRSGHLKAYKTPGGQFRVYAEDLADFMRGRNMRIPDSVAAACLVSAKASKKYKILIVDDDKGFNSVTAKLIEKNLSQVVVFQAYDGFEAGTMLVEQKPDCIVLDLDLPGVDGYGICSKIIDMESFSPAIIVVTGMQDEESERRCRDLGVLEFYRKPVMLPKLLDCIKAQLK